jgi:ribosomal protein S18 acetylase RimI-like enzyme
VRIVSYDDIRDPVQFAVLTDSAFSFPQTARQIADRRRFDARYRDPFGFGMVERGQLAGFAGVVDIKVRTRVGRVIECGGLHHIMTHPAFARRGVAARLIEQAHAHFRGRGYEFSFLFTARSLSAWRLYDRLGYEEMPLSGRQAPAAYRLRSVTGRQRALKRRGRLDYPAIERLFDRYWSPVNSTFAHDPDWLEGRIKGWRDHPYNIVPDRDGFAYVEAERDVVRVYELVARSQPARARIFRRIEALNRPVIVHYLVHDPALLRFYRARGFTIRPRAYFVCMAKPLGRTSLRTAFGPDFSWSPLDQF